MTAFYAQANGSQSTTATATEVNFGTVKFDPDSGFASNRFTVPASWDGKYAILCTNWRASTSEATNDLSIQRSTNGGSTWTDVAREDHRFSSATSAFGTCTPVMLMNYGDVYRVVYTPFTGQTTNGGTNTNFSGILLNPDSLPGTEAFQISVASNYAVGAGVFELVEWDTIDFDTSSEISFNGNVIEFGSGFPSCYALLTNGLSTTTTGRFGAYLQHSKDGFSTVYAQAQYIVGNTSSVHSALVTYIEPGDSLRAYIFAGGGATNVNTLENTRLSGRLWRTA